MQLFYRNSTLYISVGCNFPYSRFPSPDFDITVMELGNDSTPIDVFPSVQVVPIVMYPFGRDVEDWE